MQKATVQVHIGDVLEFANQPAHIVEIAVAGVAVHHDRDVGRVRHEFQHLGNLGPTRFVRVAHPVLRGHAQAAGPDALETCLFADLGTQAIVGLTNELELR